MKQLLIITMAFVSIMLSGCVIQQHGQIVDKVTVAGLELAPGTSGLSMATYSMRFGLVRHEFIHNDTATNQIYAAPFSTTTTASLSILNQSASENISTK